MLCITLHEFMTKKKKDLGSEVNVNDYLYLHGKDDQTVTYKNTLLMLIAT